MSYITIDGNVFVLPDRQVLDFGGRMENFLGIEKSVAVTDRDRSQMLRGWMGTETTSDGDGYNFCGNGWGWLDFPLPCRSLFYSHYGRIYVAVCELFSVKACDLGNQVSSRSRSLKTVPFDRPYATFYWSAIVNIALSCTILSYLTLNNIVTLKSELEVTQGH